MNLDFRILKTICALSTLCLLGAIGYGSISPQGFYGEADEINKQHAVETQRVQDVNIEDYTPAMKSREVGFTFEELDSMTDYGKYKGAASLITYEEAAADVDLAFRVLKNCYGAYFYFGGDEAFEKARMHVLSECENAGENLTVGILKRALQRNLGFVIDGHFRVDNQPVFAKALYYSNEETCFLRDEKGYYTKQDGKKNYVLFVNGSDAVEEHMKRSVNDEGMLVYRLGILSAAEKKTLDVVFESRTEKFALSPPELKIKNTTYYSDYKVNNVPVIAISSFMYEQAGRQFVDSAEKIKDSKAAILDLQGNSGGMSQYVTDWLDIYDPVLKEYASGNVYAYRRSRAADYFIYKNLEKYLSEQETERLLNSCHEGSNSWEIVEAPAFIRSENSSFLFVLVDSRTFSAGEWLIAALRNKDNVIFVGTNSGGGLMSDNAIKIVLPSSKISIQCGSGLGLYYDETVFTEKTGFSPDIWVSTDAMQHTLNLISYYGLDS